MSKINFEEDSTYLATDEEIRDIATLVKLMLKLQKDVVEAEAKLTLAKARYAKISLGELPEAMKRAKTSSFTTDDGVRIGLKEDIYASITEKNKAAAFEWLEKNNFGSIIKSQVDLAFGRGESERAAELLENLDKLGFDNYSIKETVHAGTLKALLKEQLAAGKEIPLELFSAHQFKEAILK
jgi:hypothetical protein